MSVLLHFHWGEEAWLIFKGEKKNLLSHVFISQFIPSVPATGTSFCKSLHVICHLWILPQPQQEFFVYQSRHLPLFNVQEWLCSESTAGEAQLAPAWEHPSNKSQGTEGNFHRAAHLSLGKLSSYQANTECIPWSTTLITWALCYQWFWFHYFPAF